MTAPTKCGLSYNEYHSAMKSIGHILLDPISMKHPELVNPWRRTVDWGLLVAEERGQWETQVRDLPVVKGGVLEL